MIDKMGMDKRTLNIQEVRQMTNEELSFFNKLHQTSERVKMFTRLFASRKPKYERVFE